MSNEQIQKAIDFVQQHQDAIIDGYKRLLQFPSISADPAYADDIKACAAWIVSELTRIGFDNAQVIPTAGHPVVYADWLHAGDDKPTVLVYSHYDVQPVDPLHLWDSEPFEAEVRDGRLYARGATDNKAGIWGNLKTFEAMLASTGELPLNVKVMFEGEEESGSPSMQPFVAGNKELLQADIMLNCDGGFDRENPRLAYAGRGIISADVYVKGPKADLHSGMFGGVVQNPLHVAAQIMASFHDSEGRIAIAGFYDEVEGINEAERQRIESGWQAERNESIAGTPLSWGRGIASDAERAMVYPTLDVNGMWGGYQGPGTKTIIPSEAHIKITMRLVPGQNLGSIAESFLDHVEQFSTETVKVEAKVNQEGWPFKLVTDGPYLEAVQSAMEATTGHRATLVRTGGSIPILGMFNRLFDMPITGYSYGEGDGIHSPNEYVELDAFFLALQGGIRVYHNLGAVEK